MFALTTANLLDTLHHNFLYDRFLRVSGDKVDVVCIFQNESIISEWLKGISTKQSDQKTPNGFAISNPGLAIGDFNLTRNQMLKNRKTICGSELMTRSANQGCCDLRPKMVTGTLVFMFFFNIESFWLYGYMCLAVINWIWTNIQFIGS